MVVVVVTVVVVVVEVITIVVVVVVVVILVEVIIINLREQPLARSRRCSKHLESSPLQSQGVRSIA